MNLFGMAFVWAFGGHLVEEDMINFDNFVRNMLVNKRLLLYIQLFFLSNFLLFRCEVRFPPYETVFDYFVEEETGKMTLWEDKIDIRPRVLPHGSTYSMVPQVNKC